MCDLLVCDGRVYRMCSHEVRTCDCVWFRLFLEIRDDHVVVHGSPWNGKHRLGENISLPLKAICILERGEENRIRSIGPREALTMLMQQSQRPQDRRKLPLYLDLVDKLSSRVSFYRMACNMDPSAAVIAYETMSNNK